MAEDSEAIRDAIKALAEIADDDANIPGFRFGSRPSLEVRIEAIRSLASYVPHPDAVRVLTEILTKEWYEQELRKVAAEALRNKK